LYSQTFLGTAAGQKAAGNIRSTI